MGAEDNAEPTVVYLGNRNAVEVLDDKDDLLAAADEGRAPARIRQALPGKRCTTVSVPAGLSLMEAAYDITHSTRGVWPAHSDDAAPTWVASTDPVLAQLLAAHWGCELRDPEPQAEPVTAEH